MARSIARFSDRQSGVDAARRDIQLDHPLFHPCIQAQRALLTVFSLAEHHDNGLLSSQFKAVASGTVPAGLACTFEDKIAHERDSGCGQRYQQTPRATALKAKQNSQ